MLLLALSCTKDPVVDDTGTAEVFAPTTSGVGAGTLLAGAAAVDITPPCFESWVDLDDNAEMDE